MKKCIVYLAVLSLILSLGTVFASALTTNEIYVSCTPGQYLGGDAEAFAPVGDVTIAWRPDFASTVDLTDGDLADWYATDLERTNITPHNMVSWVQTEAVTDFKITSFCAADSDYLYLAFDIVDDDFTYGSGVNVYDGDAIQIALDFGNMLGDMLEYAPDFMCSLRGTFYSFSCEADGAPIRIMRQESDQDGYLTEEGGAGVKGAARKTENGWSAEIALSWQQMFDDYAWKAWCEDPTVYLTNSPSYPICNFLRLGACLYYIDRAETNGEVLWAAGTTKGLHDGNGTPAVTWMPYDQGIMWKLPYREDLTFNTKGIVVIPPLEETDLPAIEPPYDPPIEYPETVTGAVDLPLWTETLPPEVEETLRDVAESLDKEDELNAVLAKYGCTSVLGMGSLGLLTALAAAAYVARKKH